MLQWRSQLCKLNMKIATDHLKIKEQLSTYCWRFEICIRKCLKDRLCSNHTALHSIVRPLNLCSIHKARTTSDEATTGKRQLGHRLEQKPHIINFTFIKGWRLHFLSLGT